MEANSWLDSGDGIFSRQAMVTLRQLTGWIALVIASVGPMPLWAHHTLHHAHVGCSQTCNADADGQAHPGHTHVDSQQCAHQHTAQAHQAGDLTDQRPAGWHGTSDQHDCAICYHLSQSASATGILSVVSVVLPPSLSCGLAHTTSFATLCGWPAPRGPPTANA